MNVLAEPGIMSSIMSSSALLLLLQVFEVKSTTTIGELCRSVAALLKLSSAEGYGLYLKARKKARLRFSTPRLRLSHF